MLDSADLKRMISSIENESRNSATKISQFALENYNKKKTQNISFLKSKLDLEHKNKISNLLKYKKMEKSKILSDFKLNLEKIKIKKINSLLSQVKENLKNKKITKSLITEALLKTNENLENIKIFCKKTDQDFIKQNLPENEKINKFLELPDYALGGIIITTKDGKYICDNSYKTRLEIFKEKHMDYFKDKLI